MDFSSALTRMATVHQQHAIKCFLAIQNLKQHFNWADDDWRQLEQLIDMQEPVFNTAILTSDDISFDLVLRRRHWIISHAIYPHAYFTMQQWFQTETADDIFKFYLGKCLEEKQYLSHNVSILFAFETAWPHVSNNTQKFRFIERFCEFVSSTFYGNNYLAYTPANTYKPLQAVNETDVLQVCLQRPGFWGHNLITFVSILKRKSNLPKGAFSTLLLNLYEQCHWQFEDEADKPDIPVCTLPIVSLADLESNCRKLLLDSKRNIHQITLADAVVFMFNKGLLGDSEQARLIDILAFYAKS